MTLRAMATCAALLLASDLVSADETNKMISGKPMVEIKVQDEKEEAQEFKAMRHRDKASHGKHFDDKEFDYLYRENRALRKRIHRLELAMIQLQDAVYILQQSEFQPVNYSCALTARNRGTYLGSGRTKTEAKAHARMACEQERSPFWCDGVMECDE